MEMATLQQKFTAGWDWQTGGKKVACLPCLSLLLMTPPPPKSIQNIQFKKTVAAKHLIRATRIKTDQQPNPLTVYSEAGLIMVHQAYFQECG